MKEEKVEREGKRKKGEKRNSLAAVLIFAFTYSTI